MNLIQPNNANKLLRQDTMLLDVRSPSEYQAVHARGAISLPLRQIQRDPSLIGQIARDARAVLFICKVDTRARKAAQFARLQLDCPIYVVKGGTDAWMEQGLEVVGHRSDASKRAQDLRSTMILALLAGVLLGLVASPWFLLLPAVVTAGWAVSWSTGWGGELIRSGGGDSPSGRKETVVNEKSLSPAGSNRA